VIFKHFNEIPLNNWPYRYFQPPEVACKGTGQILINEDALGALDNLRTHLGHSISLSSAYRSPYHNAKVGGAPRSSHLEGHAFDVRLQGRDKEVIRQVAEKVGFKGFGMRYQTFIHIDMGRRRSW
jgi:zinc D-Ala-D-Ala carboxypeptidase